MSAEPEDAGGLGGFIDPRNTASDLRRIGRAINQGWPISDELRALLTKQIGAIVRRSRTDRNKIAAARVLVAADSVNVRREAMEQADEHKRLPNVGVNLNVNASADLGSVRRDLLNDPDYLEYLRRGAVEDDGHSGTIRQNDQQGQVADGTPSRPDGSQAG